MLNHCEGYPEDLTELFEDDCIDIALNGAVFDLNNELVVKISADNRVMRAYKGFEVLSDSEIDQIYGESREFEFSWWEFRNIVKGYTGFLTFFDWPVICTLCKMLELKKQGKITKSPYEMFDDIKTMIIKNYVHYDDKVVHKIADYGYFFPEIWKDPGKYIQKRDDFKEMLVKLREMGKKIFLATNSHAEYTQLIMSASIGEDWMDYFDFINSKWSKPIYFKKEGLTKDFYQTDFSKDDLKGKCCTSYELDNKHIYLGGNWSSLEIFLRFISTDMSSGELPKIVFIGDNFLTDAAYANLKDNWTGISLVEEKNHETDSENQGEESKLANYQKYWGSFFYETIKQETEPVKYTWANFTEKHSKFTIGLLSDFAKLL